MPEQPTWVERVYPTHTTLLWRVEDNVLDPLRLKDIAEFVHSQSCDGLPGTIIGLSMNDHHLRIELG